MITDSGRMSLYEKALRETIRPGAVVLDIGAGTGIFSLLACQMGASKVYAVEPDNALQVAKDIASRNGHHEVITFLQGFSTQIDLPERADVAVSDLRGVLPLFQHHIPAIVDARQRLLKPGGTLIPQSDTIWVAIVTAEDLYKPYVVPWIENPYGLDMQVAHSIVVNTWRKARVKPEQLLCEPKVWATLDYRTITDLDVSGTLSWTARQSVRGHGLAVWFDAELIDGVTFSNSPDSPELIYGMAFFPWQEPVELESGDKITVALEANLVGDDYIWRWNTQVQRPDRDRPLKADFKQSTFFGAPLSPQSLLKRADHFVPALNEDGQIDHMILDLMDRGISLGEIATQVSERFAHRFRSWKDALSRVSDLSEKYSH
jgi:protein arginine N-methyltransferase 1